MYYSAFGILSLTLYILFNFKLLILDKKEDLSEAKVNYRYFLHSAILYFITDIAWGISYDTRIIPLVYADTFFYFLSMALSVMMWTRFVVKYLRNKNSFNVILTHSGRFVFALVLVSLIINFFYPILFSFEANGDYKPLPIRYSFLGIQAILFAVTAIYTFIAALKSRGKGRYRNLTITVSGVTMTAFIVLQTLYPLLPYYAVGCLLASALLHSFVGEEEEREKNRTLAEALEAAEKANTAKTLFLTGMSHEIRTPINAILGMNEIIRRESSDEKILDCTENIKEAGERLLKMMTDILDYSKMESGEMKILNAEYSMPDMIGDLYGSFNYEAESKGLRLTFDIDKAIPCGLIGDIQKMKQVLYNLLANAIKFTEKGYVVFRITLVEKSKESVKLRFIVIDTGIGIKDEERDELFQAFNRLDTERTCTIEGTGLGLTIASNILHQMGTGLKLDSTYNVGSTFYFEIEQMITDNTPIGESWIPKASSTERRNISSRSFTSPESLILLVDDTELNLKVIKGLLEPLKMQIDTANSGAECIEKFGTNNYDLVFLDYLMPEMNGIETLEKIKELYPQKAETTPIISLTASAVAGEREHMLDAGFTDYMTKPVIFSEMMKMLRKHLPKNQIHAEAEMTTAEKLHMNGIPDKLYSIDWINVKEAVEYCGNPEVYLEAIRIFIRAIDEKTRVMAECMDNNDIDLFTVTIHATKSSMQTLGIAGLSEEARQLELLGKNNDGDSIREKLPEFLEKYKGLKETLTQAIE